MLRRMLLCILLSALFGAAEARAQQQGEGTYEISFERAMELARLQGPDVLMAQAQVDEARGKVSAASLLHFNPELEASAGPRFGGEETTTDWSVGVRQGFEIGGQRKKRLAVARAGVDVTAARLEDAERLLLRKVGFAFTQSLYWKWRVSLAQENISIAEDIARVATRRKEVGDIGGLEESVAVLALARSQMDEARAQSSLLHAQGHLKILLGLEANPKILPKGDLRQFNLPGATTSLDIGARSDLRALGDEIRQAESEIDLGRSGRIPNIAIGTEYLREEGADIVHGSVSLTLPFFDHGQGKVAVAQARRGRIETELRGAKRRAEIEMETANQISRKLTSAARQFEANGLLALEHSERVATASYEAGAMPLGELLAVRRELMQANLNFADLLLEAARAQVELIASTGAWK